MSDQDVRWKIIEAVFRQESAKGHLKWSLTSIAASAKVSRSLVYYHFGRTKQEVLYGCLGMVAEEFYGLSPSRAGVPLVESLTLTNAMYRANPSYAVFFQKWRITPSAAQEVILRVEKKYEAKLAKSFPKAT